MAVRVFIRTTPLEKAPMSRGRGRVSDTTAHTLGRIRHSHGVQAPRVGQGDLRAVR